MLILVRHGRTAHNATGRLLGRLDPDLDEVGRNQAVALGAALATAPGPAPRRIITSPLARTRQTAEAIAAGLPGEIEVEVDGRWVELDYGAFDGVPLADIPAATWQAWRADPAFCPPAGESLLDLAVRLRPALDELQAEAVEHDIVVVSHVSPIKAAVAWALGTGEQVAWRLFLAPASITRIAVSAHGPSLVGFNELVHHPSATP